MITDTGAPLANLLGFITGIVLYGMLLWMVFTSRRELNRLLLLTGFLGFAWNAGALAGYGLMNLGIACVISLRDLNQLSSCASAAVHPSMLK